MVLRTLAAWREPMGRGVAAIWRNTVEDYTVYLDAFGASAPQDQAERIRMLLALLSEPNPTCAAAAANSCATRSRS